MRNLMTVALAIALLGVTAGCEAKTSDTAPGSEKSPAVQTKSTTAPAPAPSSDTRPKADESKPADDGDDAELTQDTPEGTIHLFAKAMAGSDYRTVVVLTDPTSEAYESFVSMAENLDPETTVSKAPREVLEAIASMFSAPWKEASIASLSKTDGRAKFEVTFGKPDPKNPEAKAPTRIIDVTEFQGVWRVLASNELLRPPGPAKPPAGFPVDEEKPKQPAE